MKRTDSRFRNSAHLFHAGTEIHNRAGTIAFTDHKDRAGRVATPQIAYFHFETHKRKGYMDSK